jgi:outer membrane protein assembly factor BamE (lipoprotein component of BamABCDE complex)
MKKTLLLSALVLASLASSGCSVTKYERTVTVMRDSTGNVVSTQEVEHMTQSGNRKKLPTMYLYEKGGNAAK